MCASRRAERRREAIMHYFSAVMYSGGRWLVEGANRINGNVEDRERFLQAIKEAAQGEDIRGPITLDDQGNPTQNVYILKVEKVGGWSRSSGRTSRRSS